MSSAGRLIAACLAVLAAGLVMLGCGSDEEVKVDLPPETVQAITDKLDQIQERFAAGDCTGSNSAETSLDALRSAVEGLDVDDQQFISDMNEMLDNLAEQISTQCDEAEKTTSSTTESTDTLPTTTETTDTVPTTTETTTTTKSTTTKSTTSTTTTPPPTGPPGNPDNPNGNGPGGGVVPGGGKKENSGPGKKPKPKKDGKAKDDRKERSR